MRTGIKVQLYNSFTRKKEDFHPIEDGKVQFYMCGPTVYDYIHIGNARAFIVFDVLRRFFEFSGFEVTYVLNLTDIDDKIIKRAADEKTTTEQIATKYAKAFLEDLKAIGVRSPTFTPRATEHLAEIISLIETLISKGHAYESDGDVYFSVKTFSQYGKLSGKKTDELRSGARVEVDDKKRNPLDFALWKKQKLGEPFWESAWGKGRPGWHIECSAMSTKFLGQTFDIHAGGSDLIFPHHENEIAQSECASGKKFANYWLHNGFLQIEGDKMSKSLGNFRTVQEVLAKYSSQTLRMFFLQKHYRSPIDLTEEGLYAAKSACSKLNVFYQKLQQKLQAQAVAQQENDQQMDVQKYRSDFTAALSDDFNTPVALSVLFALVRDSKSLLEQDKVTASQFDFLNDVKKFFDSANEMMAIFSESSIQNEDELASKLIDLSIEIRNNLRAKGDWELADKIRDYLADVGIALEDKQKRTVWRMNSSENIKKT